jgi:hypothetical protein
MMFSCLNSHLYSYNKKSKLSLIIALRADYYASVLQYEELRPLLETQQKIIGTMSRTELRQTIERPAQLGGWQLQPGLVGALLQEVGKEPGALPLLSHALQETWARREGRMLTFAGYRDTGGIRNSIAQTADSVYANLSLEQQAIVRNIFLRLTALGEGTEDTRRRATLTELLSSNADKEAVLNVLDLLAHKRLVILNEETGHTHAEVSHEALIREWPTLRTWLNENRNGLRIHRQLTEAAKIWGAHEEDTSYLYRGTRLAQVKEWVVQPEISLNTLELRFLNASQTAESQETLERETQRKRELVAAQQLAEARNRQLVRAKLLAEAQQKELEKNQQLIVAENLRSKTIRRAFAGLIVLLILTAIAAAFGFEQSRIASFQAAEAKRQQQIALSQSVAAFSRVVWEQENDTELATLLAIEGFNLDQNDNNYARWLIDYNLRSYLTGQYFNNTLSGHSDWVRSVAFSPNGDLLVSGSEDQTIRVWDLHDPYTEPIVLSGQAGRVLSVAFSPDGHIIASGNANHTIHLWDLRDLIMTPLYYQVTQTGFYQ